MNMVKWAKKTVSRNRRSRKAISTIMANLTMLIIVVFLSAMLFVWAISSFGLYQGGAGYWFSSKSMANQERISIENVFFSSCPSGVNNCYKIYVRNVGAIPFTIGGVYINGTLAPSISPPVVVNVTQVVCLSCSSIASWQIPGALWAHSDVQTIKVATIRGTIQTSQWVA